MYTQCALPALHLSSVVVCGGVRSMLPLRRTTRGVSDGPIPRAHFTSYTWFIEPGCPDDRTTGLTLRLRSEWPREPGCDDASTRTPHPSDALTSFSHRYRVCLCAPRAFIMYSCMHAFSLQSCIHNTAQWCCCRSQVVFRLSLCLLGSLAPPMPYSTTKHQRAYSVQQRELMYTTRVVLYATRARRTALRANTQTEMRKRKPAQASPSGARASPVRRPVWAVACLT